MAADQPWQDREPVSTYTLCNGDADCIKKVEAGKAKLYEGDGSFGWLWFALMGAVLWIVFFRKK